MLINIISRSSLKLDHVGSKTRLLGHRATQVSDLGPLWPSFISFQLIRQIIGPNKDDSDQRSQMHFLICNLYVKLCMVPFSDFYAIFMCRPVSKEFLLSKCQSAKYARKQLS